MVQTHDTEWVPLYISALGPAPIPGTVYSLEITVYMVSMVSACMEFTFEGWSWDTQDCKQMNKQSN